MRFSSLRGKPSIRNLELSHDSISLWMSLIVTSEGTIFPSLIVFRITELKQQCHIQSNRKKRCAYKSRSTTRMRKVTHMHYQKRFPFLTDLLHSNVLNQRSQLSLHIVYLFHYRDHLRPQEKFDIICSQQSCRLLRKALHAFSSKFTKTLSVFLLIPSALVERHITNFQNFELKQSISRKIQCCEMLPKTKVMNGFACNQIRREQCHSLMYLRAEYMNHPINRSNHIK